MKKLNKIMKSISVTEKVFLFVVAVLATALVFNVAGGGNSLLASVQADEGSSSSGEDSSEGSTNDSGDGEDSTDEVSTNGGDDEDSTDEVSVVLLDVEASTPSVDEVSTQEVDEVSVVSDQTASVVSEVSVQEESVHSGSNIEDYGNVELLGENLAVVTIKKKLFFLVPVDISQTVSLDDDGNVTDVRQTLLNIILSWFSF